VRLVARRRVDSEGGVKPIRWGTRWTLRFVDGPFDGLQGWIVFEKHKSPDEEVRVTRDEDGQPHVWGPDFFDRVPDGARYASRAATRRRSIRSRCIATRTRWIRTRRTGSGSSWGRGPDG
jgi:hypothetical protein